MKTTLMPTYEQLAVNNAKLSQEVLRLTRANQRLKNKRPVTKTQVVNNPEGYGVCIFILSFFIIAVGLVLINEIFGIWN